MIPVLYYSKEYRHVPLRARQKAAWQARQRAMRHWQFWASLVVLAGFIIIGSFVAETWFGDKPSGTRGAIMGSVLGLVVYSVVLYRVGMPYYREILSRYEGDEKPNAVRSHDQTGTESTK